eukprot:Hpha_TRINITY_DN15766_c4_g2::TRINITY_DN15766_c4_g2_i1::g.36319::m.36319
MDGDESVASPTTPPSARHVYSAEVLYALNTGATPAPDSIPPDVLAPPPDARTPPRQQRPARAAAHHHHHQQQQQHHTQHYPHNHQHQQQPSHQHRKNHQHQAPGLLEGLRLFSMGEVSEADAAAAISESPEIQASASAIVDAAVAPPLEVGRQVDLRDTRRWAGLCVCVSSAQQASGTGGFLRAVSHAVQQMHSSREMWRWRADLPQGEILLREEELNQLRRLRLAVFIGDLFGCGVLGERETVDFAAELLGLPRQERVVAESPSPEDMIAAAEMLKSAGPILEQRLDPLIGATLFDRLAHFQQVTDSPTVRSVLFGVLQDRVAGWPPASRSSLSVYRAAVCPGGSAPSSVGRDALLEVPVASPSRSGASSPIPPSQQLGILNPSAAPFTPGGVVVPAAAPVVQLAAQPLPPVPPAPPGNVSPSPGGLPLAAEGRGGHPPIIGRGGRGGRGGVPLPSGPPPPVGPPVAEPSREPVHDHHSRKDRTVYVVGIDTALSEQNLLDFLSTCGNLAKVRLCGDTNNRTIYGFFEFCTRAEAAKLLHKDKMKLGAYILNCSWAKSAIRDVQASPHVRQYNIRDGKIIQNSPGLKDSTLQQPNWMPKPGTRRREREDGEYADPHGSLPGDPRMLQQHERGHDADDFLREVEAYGLEPQGEWDDPFSAHKEGFQGMALTDFAQGEPEQEASVANVEQFIAASGDEAKLKEWGQGQESPTREGPPGQSVLGKYLEMGFSGDLPPSTEFDSDKASQLLKLTHEVARVDVRRSWAEAVSCIVRHKRWTTSEGLWDRVSLGLATCVRDRTLMPEEVTDVVSRVTVDQQYDFQMLLSDALINVAQLDYAEVTNILQPLMGM